MIPKIKLEVKLEWHLGIPDGEKTHKSLADYVITELAVKSIIWTAMVEAGLWKDIDPEPRVSHIGDNYYIEHEQFDTLKATVTPVLYFAGRKFKLEELD